MATREVSIFIKLRDKALKKLKFFSAAAHSAASALKRMGEVGKKALWRIGSALNTLRRRMQTFLKYALLAGPAVAVYMSKKFTSSIIKVGAAYEMLRTQISVAMKTTREELNKTWSAILGFAARSPLMTREVVGAFSALRAAGVKNTLQIVKDLGSLGIIFGRQVDELASIFLGALARPWRRMGILIKRETDGAIIRSGRVVVRVKNDQQAIWQALAKVIRLTFKGAMDRARETWIGLINTMRGHWDLFLMEIAKSGFMDRMKSLAEAVNKMFERTRKTGELQTFAKSISDILSTILDKVVKFMLVSAPKFFARAKRILSGVLIVIKGVLAMITRVARAMGRLIVSSAKYMGHGISSIRQEIKDFNAMLKAVAELKGPKRAITVASNMLDTMFPTYGVIRREFSRWISPQTYEMMKTAIGLDGVEKSLLHKREQSVALLELMFGTNKSILDTQQHSEKATKNMTGIQKLASHLYSDYLEATKKTRIEQETNIRAMLRGNRMLAAETKLEERLLWIEERKTAWMNKQEKIRNLTASMSHEEAAKLEWIAKNAHKISAESLARNKDLREFIRGSEAALRVPRFREALMGAKAIIEGPAMEAIRKIADPGPLTTVEAHKRADESRRPLELQYGEHLTRISADHVELDVNVNLLNHIEAKIDMNIESVAAALYARTSEGIKLLATRFDEEIKKELKPMRSANTERIQLTPGIAQ